MTLILLLGIAGAFIVLILLLIFSAKGEHAPMSKLRNAYLYLVSFVSLMMILIGTIFTVQNMLDVLFPTYYNYGIVEADSDMTPQEKEKAEAYRLMEIQNQQINDKKNVAKSASVVVIALPAFLYHWKKIQRERIEAMRTDLSSDC